jgi:hypothetical protein
MHGATIKILWSVLPCLDFDSLHDSSHAVKHLWRKQLAMRIPRHASVTQKWFRNLTNDLTYFYR